MCVSVINVTCIKPEYVLFNVGCCFFLSSLSFASVCKASRHACRKDTDPICYIFEEDAFKDCRRNIHPHIKAKYKDYFKMKLETRLNVLHSFIVSKVCSGLLCKWSSGKQTQMPFSTPMVWQKPNNHPTDCCFFISNVMEFNKKKAKNAKYIKCLGLSSAIKPQTYEDEILLRQ